MPIPAGSGVDYVDLATLKRAMHITDTDRDDLLTLAISSASRHVDQIAGRRFYLDGTPAARVLNPRGSTLSDPDGERLLVPDIGSTSDLVVETGSASEWTPYAGFDAESPGETWPVTALIAPSWRLGARSRVRITARWGWPAVPAEIVQATQIQAIRLFSRKDSPEGVAGSADWGVIRLGRSDPDVAALIQPYVRYGFG